MRSNDRPCMSDFAWFDGANLVGAKGDNGQRIAVQRDEFHFVAFFAMHQDDHADFAHA